MGRGNQYIQLVKVLQCKPPIIGKQPIFSQVIRGYEPQASELEGECVTTAPLWPLRLTEMEQALVIGFLWSFLIICKLNNFLILNEISQYPFRTRS